MRGRDLQWVIEARAAAASPQGEKVVSGWAHLMLILMGKVVKTHAVGQRRERNEQGHRLWWASAGVEAGGRRQKRLQKPERCILFWEQLISRMALFICRFKPLFGSMWIRGWARLGCSPSPHTVFIVSFVFEAHAITFELDKPWLAQFAHKERMEISFKC